MRLSSSIGGIAPALRGGATILGAVLCLGLGCAGDAVSGSRGSGGDGVDPRTPSTGVMVPGASNPIGGGSPGQIMPHQPVPQTMTDDGNAGSSSTPKTPISIDETGDGNPAGLMPDDVAKLMAGGPGAPRLLYPYDGTVFPRGLLAPLLMWEGDNTDVVYVHIQAQSFEYKGVLKAALDPTTMAPQLQLPQELWVKAGQQTNGKNDPFLLELTVRSGGTVQGPIVSHFNIAQATVKGSIYYNTYASRLPGAAVGGNVLRIPAGGTAELFNSFTCNGCHAVSADGSRMLSQIDLTSGGNAYQLVSGGPANPMGTPAGQRVSFGALYPDGSKYLSTSTAVSIGHAEIAEPPGTPPDSVLFDTASGQPVPDTDIPTGAVMPMFSPDGTRLAFTDNAVDAAHGLAVMDYDVKANKAANYKVLMKDEGASRPGWPFFLPDSKGVVFIRTVSPDFTANGAFIGAGTFGDFAGPFAPLTNLSVQGPVSDLFIADVASGTVTLLGQAMGFKTAADVSSETSYLPFPDDTHGTYFPTVSPVAAGGYFWVFFDSIRHYGNLGLQRQLWGTAVDIHPDGTYTIDPSHPAFYLPGQEFGSGNHRAFAALDPCKRDGDSCTSGIDCCGGTCSFPETHDEFSDPVGTCAPPPMNTCSKRDERCASSADCCPAVAGEGRDSCIAGFCAYVPVL